MSYRDEASAEYSLGLDFLGKGDLENARSAFERTLMLQPDHVDAHYSLARLFAEQEDWEIAVSRFRRVLELNPLFVQGYGELGQALMMLGRFDEAIKSLNALLDESPEDPVALTNLAVALRQTGESREARALFERAIRLAPSLAEAYQGLTEILVDAEGDIGAAEVILLVADSAVVDSKKRALIQLSLGHVKLMQGALEDGILWFDKSLQTDPTSYDAQIALALALSDAHRYSQSLEALHKAIRQRPGSAEAHACLGSALEKLGRHAEAVAAFEAARSLDPACLETEGPDWSVSYSRALTECKQK